MSTSIDQAPGLPLAPEELIAQLGFGKRIGPDPSTFVRP
jgi:hypothetical protein